MNNLIHKKTPVIIQFGTSRFLQAHVDYFVASSIAQGTSNTKIVVVQSSSSATGKAKVAAINKKAVYPVHIQGMYQGEVVDRIEQIDAFCGAIQASADWDQLVELFCYNATHMVSNTADQGYMLFDDDSLADTPQKSFPAKLLSLLFARYLTTAKPITLMPCELIANNGSTLKAIILKLAQQWQMDAAFIQWLDSKCMWVNSLVDRIVSKALEPLGAVAEPYALWAIEQQVGLELPCVHRDVRVVSSLKSIEWLKLSLLNLSHSYLVDLWMRGDFSEIKTVFQAMQNNELRSALQTLLDTEIVPVLEAMSLGEDVQGYLASVFERFENPFLEHQLSDIAQNHAQKIERRLLPIFEQGHELLPKLAMTKLKACLVRNEIQLEG
ncbi:mannitol dehydrogenase family protein [Gammaproteobacteria bacterium AS21]